MICFCDGNWMILRWKTTGICNDMENHEKHMEMKEKHMEMREVLAIMVETVVEYGCEFVSRRLDTIC